MNPSLENIKIYIKTINYKDTSSLFKKQPAFMKNIFPLIVS